MSRLIDEIVTLTKEGWRPYRGDVQETVYQRLDCPHGLLRAPKTRVRPYWFARGDMFLCVGCFKKCSLTRPAGFIALLPLPQYSYDPAEPFTLTPQELVARRHTLNVKEVAYCLNVSESLVYRYIYEGRLVAHREKPTRVRASDVAALMNDFDE